MEVERLMPNSYESEVALLGSIMIEPGILAEVPESLCPDSFYAFQNRLIFQTMMHLFQNGQDVDFITICSHLKAQGDLDKVGGEAFIIGLLNEVPTSVNAPTYAKTVLAMHQRRKLIALASTVANLAHDFTLSEADLLTQVDAIYYKLALQQNGSKTLKSLGEMVADHMAMVETRDEDWEPGIPTGLADLDNLIGGLKKGKYIIGAGRPGMGKTALADTISLHAARHGHRVGILDLDTDHENKTVRLAANAGRMNTREVEEMRTTSDFYFTYLQVIGDISRLPIFVESLTSLSPALLRRKLTYMRQALGVDLVVIDYLQLMEDSDKSGSREREIASVSRTIKSMAKELQIPILALVQLNRNVEHRADKRPMKSDLSGSGALEADADMIWLLYRDDYYNPDTSERPNVVEINVDKHKNGPPGVVDVYWNKTSARFANLQKVQYVAPRLHVNGNGKVKEPQEIDL